MAIVLMRDEQTGEIIGYTYAGQEDAEDRRKDVPREDTGEKTAYVYNTALHSEYQGHHLVGKLMEILEKELKKRGFEFLERDSAVRNNYAANIKKSYGDRVIYEEPHDSKWGQQIFFRIRLEK